MSYDCKKMNNKLMVINTLALKFQHMKINSSKHLNENRKMCHSGRS